jgi:hypothetical protein
MSGLTQEQIRTFRKNGWTELEIKRIGDDLDARPQAIDLQNAAWKQVFTSRLNYIRARLDDGYKLREVYTKINAYLARNTRSPWDYIREAYPVRGGKKSDFNARVAARGKINRHYKGDYKRRG